MPLSMMDLGVPAKIQKVLGKDETRKFLENLGFVSGSEVTVVNELGGNLIVNIKDTRVALSRALANKIMIS